MPLSFEQIKVLAILVCFSGIIIVAICTLKDALKKWFEKDSYSTSRLFIITVVIVMVIFLALAGNELNDVVITLFSTIVGYSLRRIDN